MYLIKTEIKPSSIQGEGYFSKEFIPIGTIIYLYSESDKRISKEEFEQLSKNGKQHIEEFAVEDEFGNWVETSAGAFTNHSCNANILPLYISGQYTSIVVSDIKIGDEITTDYRLFFSSTKWSMKCNCKGNDCLGNIGFGEENSKKHLDLWSTRISGAVLRIDKVAQPIHKFKDRFAQEISNAIKSTPNPLAVPFTKYSLISL